MSSGWSLRKLLITWAQMDLLFSALAVLPSNLSLPCRFILCATRSFMLITDTLSSLHFSEIQLLQ